MFIHALYDSIAKPGGQVYTNYSCNYKNKIICSSTFLIFSTTLLITCSLIGCSKDKDGTITVYGYANVNGVAYKDYVSIHDAFHPDLPIKPTLFNGDRLGVYNDSIFIFQFYV